MTRRQILPILGAILGMVLTASLGRWQLSRAAQKNTMQATLVQREQMPLLDGTTLARPLPAGHVDELVYRHMQLDGRWLQEYSVYLDNRTMNHRPGFYVVTPLMLSGGDHAVLVLRGWAPRDFHERTQLPEVRTPAGEVQVEGRLVGHAPATFALGEDGTGMIRQNLDLEHYRQETGLPLAPLLLQQLGAPSDGLQRDWPALDAGVERHYGYAVQWFGMCALLAVLVLWFQFLKPYLARRH